ncbi:uncharacterized protein [Nicotiana sylvestris]|uniref:uncharacterized protein n=1 Tax=Nicotiana sylvestris TaxID=4096 RepID=UPI00388CA2E7
MDCFAWSHSDITGIPPEVMTHKLNEDPTYPHVKQKKKQGTFKNQVIQEKVQKLLKIGSIRKVKYPNWLANTVVVPKKNGRLAKWAIELSEYDITYQPRTAIKSQVLADFIVDFSQGRQLEAEKELQVFNGANLGTWTLFTDGSSNVKGAGLGIVLVPPTGETIRQVIKCHSITNNKAEYEAVIAGLELALELGINQIIIKSDSQLVVNQMLGTYTAKEVRMQQYLAKVWDLIKQFQTWKVTLIPRDENVEADALANLASAVDLRNKIVAFLQYGTVPEDKKKAHALQKKATRYCLKQGNLYRKMFGGPLARCLRPSQKEYVMREIHEGHCGNHAGGRSLVRTLIVAGYYWPKMKKDAESFVAKCDKCQRYGNNMHRPVELLHPVIALWPFMKWGMDIVGPLPQAKGQVKFFLIITDYFTKWVEAGAFKHVREKKVRDFIWHNIICRFGVPKEIVCDNGPQFIGAQIIEFFQSWQIKRITSTPYHPVGNGPAESTNKVIINNLKKHLEEYKGNWPEVIPGVLWAYSTTAKIIT